MQLAAAQRRYELLHQDKPYHDGTRTFWMEKPSLMFPFHAHDGVTIFLTPQDLGFGGDFLKQARSIPEQAPSE